MKVLVSLEYRFKRTPDGKVWTEMSFQYPFWQRYLNVFSRVEVIARIQDVESLKTKHHLASGDNVNFNAIPYYHGPKDYLKKKNKIKKEISSILSKHSDAAIIMRVGSPIADIIQNKIKTRPYGLEVVGDPWDVFRPGTINSPLRPFMRAYFAYKLKSQCSKASTLSYVTEKALQVRYPGKKNAFTIGASTIQLEENHLKNEPKQFNKDKKEFIYVGTLEQLQKAPDIIIEAIAKVKTKNSNFKVNFIGDGKCKKDLIERAKELKIEDFVEFKGLIPAGEAIRNELDKSDFFLLPSRGEGLPRAMIEAMARRLPAIGSDIGGIKELIDVKDIVKAGDIDSLAQKMIEFLNVRTEEDHLKTSNRNFETSKKYLNQKLKAKRTQFYSYLKDQTQNWLDKK